MTQIKWETPPAKKTGLSNMRYGEFADAVRERPGEWALFSEDAPSSTVTAINKGRLVAFEPAGHFEARGAALSIGRSKVWARYVGGAK